jgi:uncharacterized membrane protein YeaQ/YmgE (transglycosylase-associated protein family)
MKDPQVGWIAAIIIGGVAGWLAEQFMKRAERKANDAITKAAAVLFHRVCSRFPIEGKSGFAVARTGRGTKRCTTARR